MSDLAKKMVSRADADGLPNNHNLRTLAAELDNAPPLDGSVEAIKSLLGRWARARRAWCDYTGEDLV